MGFCPNQELKLQFPAPVFAANKKYAEESCKLIILAGLVCSQFNKLTQFSGQLPTSVSVAGKEQIRTTKAVSWLKLLKKNTP